MKISWNSKDLASIEDSVDKLKTELVPIAMRTLAVSHISAIERSISYHLGVKRTDSLLTIKGQKDIARTSTLLLPPNFKHKHAINSKFNLRTNKIKDSRGNVKVLEHSNTVLNLLITINTLVTVNNSAAVLEKFVYKKSSSRGSYNYGTYIDGIFYPGMFPIHLDLLNNRKKLFFVQRLRSSYSAKAFVFNNPQVILYREKAHSSKLFAFPKVYMEATIKKAALSGTQYASNNTSTYNYVKSLFTKLGAK